MNIVTGSREDAIHALINTWLSFPIRTCGVCGESDNEKMVDCMAKKMMDVSLENPVEKACFIATNAQIFEQFVKDQKSVRETRANKWASNKDKTIRQTLSFPPGLLEFLTLAFRKQYEEGLFNTKFDMKGLARKFPVFQIPEEI